MDINISEYEELYSIQNILTQNMNFQFLVEICIKRTIIIER